MYFIAWPWTAPPWTENVNRRLRTNVVATAAANASVAAVIESGAAQARGVDAEIDDVAGSARYGEPAETTPRLGVSLHRSIIVGRCW
jgi:hypothetical protein